MGSSTSTEIAKPPTPTQFVMNTIQSNAIVIFGTTWCPYCDRAKALFNHVHRPYKSIEMDKREDGKEIAEVLYQMTNMRTVPNIFIRGMHIGGYSETVNLHSKGKLVDLIDNGNTGKESV